MMPRRPETNKESPAKEEVKIDKLPYYKPYTNIDQMKTEGQRESATRYNNMQKMCIQLGGMEPQ